MSRRCRENERRTAPRRADQAGGCGGGKEQDLEREASDATAGTEKQTRERDQEREASDTTAGGKRGADDVDDVVSR